MGFNDPTGLPTAFLQASEPVAFDIHDDELMHDLLGKKLCKPIQALLLSHAAGFGVDLESELKALRAAVKEIYQEEY